MKNAIIFVRARETVCAMLTNKSHLENAKRLFAQGDSASLRYCALELRTSIELLCYDRFSMYVEEISDEELRKWRPQDVVNLLLECDPESDQDCTFGIAKELPGGGTAPPRMLGASRGITKKFIRTHYHRLGAYLHAPTLREVRSHAEPSQSEMRAQLKETIDELELFAKSSGMANFGTFITFACGYCGAKNKRNVRALEEQNRVKCIGPACAAEFVVQDFSGVPPRIEPVLVPWTCARCKTVRHIFPRQVNAGQVLTCDTCKLDWYIDYTLKPVDERPDATPKP